MGLDGIRCRWPVGSALSVIALPWVYSAPAPTSLPEFTCLHLKLQGFVVALLHNIVPMYILDLVVHAQSVGVHPSLSLQELHEVPLFYHPGLVVLSMHCASKVPSTSAVPTKSCTDSTESTDMDLVIASMFVSFNVANPFPHLQAVLR
ncbi:uncharacterized protein GGS25DRAFT_429191 [Hypoxylon fragiforme]|uniref:uncharacterized protein n=1 Tax=Hypoxylon fragiforme TaxID=63214 RepID=UPI0020C6AB9B|nr:uncharacterized protein GGS25DRAFT_429191 [Hypoxylon fragiforme]KAI2605417.1 hypothetical protein GGS25DRAFT_429191 [Hypoxylon fragiforme]